MNLTKATFGSVKVGQKAVIKFNDYTYDGVVTEVAKAASSGASSLSSLNSASGSSSSSSSSLTQGASGVTATVKINNPDDHLCLGLDAKVEIQTDAKNNVLQIPKNCVNMNVFNNMSSAEGEEINGYFANSYDSIGSLTLSDENSSIIKNTFLLDGKNCEIAAVCMTPQGTNIDATYLKRHIFSMMEEERMGRRPERSPRWKRRFRPYLSRATISGG